MRNFCSALFVSAFRPFTPHTIQRQKFKYRVVQLDFTPEIEVVHMLFDRCHTKNRKSSIKQHTEYFNFLSKILLDHPVKSSNFKYHIRV